MSTGPTPDETHQARSTARVNIFRIVGLVAAAVGVVAGLALALRRREVTCPDGTRFPRGTEDFRCFSHPTLAQGFAVIAICVALGALIVICGEIAASQRARRPSAPSAS